MSKEIEEIRHWKAVAERRYEIAKEQQQKIEELQKEVKESNRAVVAFAKSLDMERDNNTKLKEQVKEVFDLLHLCNSSDVNVDKAILILSKLTK